MSAHFEFRSETTFPAAGSPETAEATIAIFGASGDLTARKLIPALFTLWHEGYLADHVPIVGVARREKSDEEFRAELLEPVRKYARVDSVTDEDWARFAGRLYYHQLDLSDVDGFGQFGKRLDSLESEAGMTDANRVVYLAVAPHLFEPSVDSLSRAGLVPKGDDATRLRVVIEKPFGTDLASARKLACDLGRMLEERQIYRIDHYLGKETVQNILLFRFGNGIFEPMLNRNHVDHVQITVAESQGMERGRGGYYDTAGALRDVLQNHVLQLLCLIGMEPPSLFRAEDIRDEKLKVLEALRPGRPGDVSNWAVGGQYVAGEVDGERANGYREEDRVPADSRRETFVAMECHIDNWRWAGVPFYLRTGKRMPQRVTEIAVQFKTPPVNLFTTVECDENICNLVGAQPNQLVFRIQPKEAIAMKFCTKRPGMQYQIHPVTMDFHYDEAFGDGLPEAYERLLLDVCRGDSTLFTRSDELEAAWKFVTPVLDWFESDSFQPAEYAAGSWGPGAAMDLVQRTGREWRVPRSDG